MPRAPGSHLGSQNRHERAPMPPEFVLYGPARCVLVLALLPERDTLRQCCSTPDSLDFPVHRWVNLGKRLALVQ
jgi:hypothetical protein